MVLRPGLQDCFVYCLLAMVLVLLAIDGTSNEKTIVAFPAILRHASY